MPTELPRLSKTRFLAGLQCHKRLWLECHARELADEPDAMTGAVLAMGTEVGAVARERFPGGRLIREDHLHHDEALGSTRSALADPSVPAIYEAAFLHDDIRIRADIVVRRPDGLLDLIEVKASTGVKPEHSSDVAVQLHVLEGAGLRVGGVYLMHLCSDYVFAGGAYDLPRLFTLADVGESARGLRGDVVAALRAMRAPLGADMPPPIETGPHCERPYRCPFYGHCHAGGPEFPIETLPRLRNPLRERLLAGGIRDIRDIPPDFDGLNPLQARVRDVVGTGERIIDPAIRMALSAARMPIRFLDFETWMPALPRYPGTSPYQTIPFQWSLHRLDDSGFVQHREFLHEGRGDPRRPFAESLLADCGTSGSIVVYTEYEERCLRELEAALPDLAPRLAGLRARIFDLHPVIRAHVYDPAFEGSFSLKTVLPALLPRLAYDDLAIQDGGLASLTYGELQDSSTPPGRAAALRADLLAYCRRDTEALLELYRLLR